MISSPKEILVIRPSPDGKLRNFTRTGDPLEIKHFRNFSVADGDFLISEKCKQNSKLVLLPNFWMYFVYFSFL